MKNNFRTNQLQEILQWLKKPASSNARLVSDSRVVEAGDVFFAYPGKLTDGRTYISQAIENGASAILYEGKNFPWNNKWCCNHRAVNNLKHLSGFIAHAYYGYVDKKMLIIAVTGTNGKTSCTQWIGQTLSNLGQMTGVIGTLGVNIYSQGDWSKPEVTGNTTPDALLLQRTMQNMYQKNIDTLVIEASSIGLEQGRLNGTHIDVALLTNFTWDHLDYHGDIQHYEAAKKILFNWPGLKKVVINMDDDMGLRIAKYLRHSRPMVSVVGYSCKEETTLPGILLLNASKIDIDADGTIFHVSSPFGSSWIRTKLIGDFNVSNILGVLGVLIASYVPWDDAVYAVEHVIPIPGRMQQLGGYNAPLIFIDYAHTPDALKKILKTLRKIARKRDGKLWCVFGCGGDRDPSKRSRMGALSEIADHVIITSDNPRSEDPETIVKHILSGMREPKSAQLFEDRANAISWFVNYACEKDVVLLAGKGHENHQEIKSKKIPFSDVNHVALELTKRTKMKSGSV